MYFCLEDSFCSLVELLLLETGVEVDHLAALLDDFGEIGSFFGWVGAEGREAELECVA